MKTRGGNAPAVVRALRFVLLAVGVALFPATGRADLPVASLDGVFPPGGRQGSTVSLRLAGNDLDEIRDLRFSHPGIRGRRRGSSTGLLGIPSQEPPEFLVEIDESVPPGTYDVRVLGRFGASNPRPFVVGWREELQEVEGDKTAHEPMSLGLGNTVNGRLETDADVDSFALDLARGDRVFVDCRARRIGSPLEAVLVLHDSSGVEVARSSGSRTRDPLIDFTARRDGRYLITLHDLVYRGGPGYVYRLSVGTSPRLDFVWPPVGLRGGEGRFTLYGRNLSGGRPSTFIAPDGVVLEELELTVRLPWEPLSPVAGLRELVAADQLGVDLMPYRLETPYGFSNTVLLSLADVAVTLEEEPNDRPSHAQTVAVPSEIAGRFYPAGDRDWVVFEATEGEMYSIEVYSHRLGRATDPRLRIEQVRGGDDGTNVVATVDDLDSVYSARTFNAATADPAYRFRAARSGEYRVLVEDALSGSRADVANVYRLSVRHARPDYRLTALAAGGTRKPQNVLLRRGGTGALEVVAFRRCGFAGEIRLSVEGLPPGVICRGAVLGRGEQNKKLLLEAADDIAPWTGPIAVRGEATVAGAPLVRHARPAAVREAAGGSSRSRGASVGLASELVLAVTDVEETPFKVKARSETLEMARGGRLGVSVDVLRKAELNGAFDVSVVDLPPDVKLVGEESKKERSRRRFTIPLEETSGQFELEVSNDAPTGLFSFHLLAQGNTSYRRHPEAVAQARARLENIETLVTTLESVAPEAQAALDTTAALAATTAEVAGGELAVTAAAAADAKEALSKAAEELASKLAVARENLDVARTQLEAVSKAAEPAQITVGVRSPAIFLRVTDAPHTLTLARGRGVLHQGSSLEIPFGVARRYDFDGEISVRLSVPDGVSGIRAEPVEVATGDEQGMLRLEATADAKKGEYLLQVRAVATWGDEERIVAKNFLLRIVSASIAKP